MLLIVGSGANFTMGPNEQNLHFTELRKIECSHIHDLVLPIAIGLPGLEAKYELFIKERKNCLPSLGQADYSGS